MDPLSITASITGILSLSITTCQGLITYYSSWKDADSDIATFSASASSVTESLQYLERYLNEGTIPAELSLQLKSCLEGCEAATRSLQKKLRKISAINATGTLSSVEIQIKKSLYPFKKGTLIRLKEIVEDLRQNLLGVLQCVQLDQLFEQSRRLDKIGQNATTIKHIASRQFRIELWKWLNVPDSTATHEEAFALREANTGEWFLSGKGINDWLDRPSEPSLLWLQGDAGSGKTVLCSATVKMTQDKCEQQSDRLLAYYYFDLNRKATCAVDGLIRSILGQLASKDDRCYDHLSDFWDECNGGMRQPTFSELVRVVNDMFIILRDSYVYVIVDGLDECAELDRLTSTLQSIVKASRRIGCTHRYLFLSRKRKTLQDNLAPLTPTILHVKGPPIEADIKRFVAARLANDAWWGRWPISVRNNVLETLTSKAEGMFQWAKCQLDALKKSKNLSMLQKCLQELPTSLESTYERSLKDIDPLYFEYSRRMLEWLCFSVRPLTIDEMNDVLATTLGESPRFEPETRFLDPNDVQDLCPGLVSVAIDPRYSRRYPVMKLSHSSVRDYLLLNHQGVLGKYNLTEQDAQNTIASICIAYLLTFRKPGSLSMEDLKERFPLARYAAEHWAEHVRNATKTVEGRASAKLSNKNTESIADRSSLSHLLRQMLDPNTPSNTSGIGQLARPLKDDLELVLIPDINEEAALRALIPQSDDADLPIPDRNHEVQDPSPQSDTNTGNEGLGYDDDWARDDIVWIPGLRRAIENNNDADVDAILSRIEDNVDASIRLPERLEVFVRSAKNEAVRKIMQHLQKICPDKVRPLCSSAVVSAVQSSNMVSLDILLSYDIDPNARLNAHSWEDDTALTAAIVHKDPVSLRKLIRAGADVNQRSHRGKTPLYLAIKYEAQPEEVEIVENLVHAGARVNARSEGRTALHRTYKPEIVKILLAREDILVNLVDDRGRTAFDNALARRADWKVAALLEKDSSLANHHSRSIANLWRTETSFLKQILKSTQVELNATDGHGDALLLKVTEFADLEKLELLLAHGADAMANGRLTFHACHIAALYGKPDLQEIFTKHQISIPLLPPRSKTALHVAAERDDDLFIEECILRCSPEIFAMQDEAGRTPLHCAIEHFHTYAIRRLGRFTKQRILDDRGRHPMALAKQCGNKVHISFLECIGFTDQGLVQPMGIFVSTG